jgi:hypothetical protein
VVKKKKATHQFIVENNAVNKDSISMKMELENYNRMPSYFGRASTGLQYSLMGENVAARVREVKDLRK